LHLAIKLVFSRWTYESQEKYGDEVENGIAQKRPKGQFGTLKYKTEQLKGNVRFCDINRKAYVGNKETTNTHDEENVENSRADNRANARIRVAHKYAHK